MKMYRTLLRKVSLVFIQLNTWYMLLYHFNGESLSKKFPVYIDFSRFYTRLRIWRLEEKWYCMAHMAYKEQILWDWRKCVCIEYWNPWKLSSPSNRCCSILHRQHRDARLWLRNKTFYNEIRPMAWFTQKWVNK